MVKRIKAHLDGVMREAHHHQQVTKSLVAAFPSRRQSSLDVSGARLGVSPRHVACVCHIVKEALRGHI